MRPSPVTASLNGTLAQDTDAPGLLCDGVVIQQSLQHRMSSSTENARFSHHHDAIRFVFASLRHALLAWAFLFWRRLSWPSSYRLYTLWSPLKTRLGIQPGTRLYP